MVHPAGAKPGSYCLTSPEYIHESLAKYVIPACVILSRACSRRIEPYTALRRGASVRRLQRRSWQSCASKSVEKNQLSPTSAGVTRLQAELLLRGWNKLARTSDAQLGQVMLYGKLDQLGRILHADFVHDVAAMHFHGSDANPQPGGDAQIRLTAGHELQHLALTRG